MKNLIIVIMTYLEKTGMNRSKKKKKSFMNDRGKAEKDHWFRA